MTRGKQIIEEAKRIIAEAHERGNNNPMVDLVITLSFSLGARWADKHPDIDVRTMAAWQSGYNEAIDKACNWLEEELPRYVFEGRENKPYISIAMIDNFKVAMKGGEG